MDRLPDIPREQMVGWSDRRLHDIIVKLGKLSERSADQDAMLAFLLDAATRRKQDVDPLP